MKKDAVIPNRRLREARELRGWSQHYVAGQLGVERYYISRWERGVTSPSPHYRQQLCQLFGVDARALGLLSDIPASEGMPASETSTHQQEMEPVPPLPAPSAPVWHLPYRRNPFFTGRETILQCLYDALNAEQAVALTQVQTISGLGGIGKTQTAVEYAYRFRQDYQAVLWVRAETPEVLRADFAALAAVLHLPERGEQNQELVIEAVRRWLVKQTDWLLILDNMEELNTVSEVLPLASRGHILLTSRAQVTGTLAHRIDLDKMGPEEGALFLLRRAKRLAPHAPVEEASPVDRATAQDITLLLDGLPLALDQAGAYLEETGCSLSDYLKAYQSHPTTLLSRRGIGSLDHPASVTTTFALALELVESVNPVAADLLSLCAFLHPDAIPTELIGEGIAEFESKRADLAHHPLVINEAIKELRRFSLVYRHPDTNTLSVHRLVQAVIKESMDEETRRCWAERVVRSVNRVFPDGEFATWQQCHRYLPQVYACANLVEQWHLICPEAGRLFNQTGVYLRECAQLAQSQSFLEKALAMREQVLEPDHPDIATSLNDMGELYCYQSKHAEAEPLFQRALAVREKMLEPMHPSVAESLNNLGRLYTRQGKYAQAEPLFQRALAIREQALGPEHPEVAQSLNTLARLYYFEGKYAQAEPLLQRALAIREQALGPEHPRVALCLNYLADLFCIQGRYSEAEALCQRAFAIYSDRLGPEHPHAITSLHTLAQITDMQGQHGQAELLYQHVLDIREKILGAEHPEVAESCFTLARFYSRSGDVTRAEPFNQRALTIWECALGRDHPRMIACLEHYANLLRKLKQQDRAATYEA